MTIKQAVKHSVRKYGKLYHMLDREERLYTKQDVLDMIGEDENENHDEDYIYPRNALRAELRKKLEEAQ